MEIPWSRHHRPPRLRGAAAWIECQPYAEVEAGDHILFLGRVSAHRTLSKEPLLFHTGRFRLVGDRADGRSEARPNLPGSAADFAGTDTRGGGRDGPRSQQLTRDRDESKRTSNEVHLLAAHSLPASAGRFRGPVPRVGHHHSVFRHREATAVLPTFAPHSMRRCTPRAQASTRWG